MGRRRRRRGEADIGRDSVCRKGELADDGRENPVLGALGQRQRV